MKECYICGNYLAERSTLCPTCKAQKVEVTLASSLEARVKIFLQTLIQILWIYMVFYLILLNLNDVVFYSVSALFSASSIYFLRRRWRASEYQTEYRWMTQEQQQEWDKRYD
jgi:hypothetical protein